MAVLADLVGRAAELGTLDRALAELDRGGSVDARAGGRARDRQDPPARRARRARRRARAPRARRARASELERDLPFWVFVDALDEYVAGLEPHRLDALDDEIRARARARLSLAVSFRRGAVDRALQHERYRTHRAVRELLELLAATKPLVLVLDDLHWADSASVELLGALLRRPPAAPVLIAMALRPRQLPERLSAALERAHRAGALAPRRAGRPHARPRPRAARRGGRRRGGSRALRRERRQPVLPRAARPLAGSSAPDAPAGVSSPLAGLDVPPAVAAALAEELALLSDGARRVLEGAAVAGDPFEPELAAAAAATSETWRRSRPSTSCSRLDLVRATDVPRRFRFRHPLVRRAVYESTPGGWRLGAHERSAEALAARGAPAAARAHHVERSARQGDAAAVASCARPARRPHSARPPAPRSGSAPRCGSCPTPRRPSARGAPARARAGAGRDAGGSPRRTRRCSRASRSSRPRRSRCACGSRRVRRRRAPARPPRARRTPASRARSTSCRPGVAGGGGADDRARGRRLLPHGLRRCASGPSGRSHRAAARRPAADRAAVARSRCGAASGPPRRPRHAARRRPRWSTPDRRGARRPPRRRRQPRRRRALPRPLRGGGRARRAGAGGRPRDRAGRVLPAPVPDSRAGSCCAGGWPKPPSCSTAPSRPRGCRATSRRWPGALQPLLAALAAGDLETALAAAEESVELRSGLRAEPRLRRRAWCSPPRCSRPATAGAVDVLVALRRRRRAPAHSRRLARQVPRAADPLLARARPPRRRRSARPPRAQARGRDAAAPHGARDGAIAPPRPSRSTPAARRAPPSARSPGRRRGRGRRPGRGRARADARRPRAGAGRRPRARGRRARAGGRRASTPAARSATATRPSASCAGSAATSTGARGRQGRGPASTRSPSASSRSRAWSSTARPTPRSRPSSSSARRPSRRTCATSSASSACPPASSWRAPSNAPIAPRTQPEATGVRIRCRESGLHLVRRRVDYTRINTSACCGLQQSPQAFI